MGGVFLCRIIDRQQPVSDNPTAAPRGLRAELARFRRGIGEKTAL